MKVIRIMPQEEVMTVVGTGKTAFKNLLQRDKTFPKPVRRGERGVGFMEDEVADWIEARRRQRIGPMVKEPKPATMGRPTKRRLVPPTPMQGAAR
jgi:predicted DNA-binding transcriptional regulator AlpA